MPRYNKQEDFEAGIQLVTPFFKSLDYSRVIAEPKTDKEGTFFLVDFTCESRAVELHHLYSLGPVIYKIGAHFIEHTAYLEALGVASQVHYPSYEDNSKSGYAALLHDLELLLTPFFAGSVEEFSAFASEYMASQRQKNQEEQRKFAYWGSLEARLKARARELFKEKQFADVVKIESQIQFPDFLTEPERLMFSLARKQIEKR